MKSFMGANDLEQNRVEMCKCGNSHRVLVEAQPPPVAATALESKRSKME